MGDDAYTPSAYKRAQRGERENATRLRTMLVSANFSDKYESMADGRG